MSSSASAHLVTAPNFASPDDFYEALIDTHRGLALDASHALNARLILLLANHVGRLDVLRQALALARAGAETPAEAGPAA